MAKGKLLDKDGQEITLQTKKAETGAIAKLPVQAENLMAVLMRVASDPTSQPDKMRALLDMRNELMAQEAEVMFHAAFLQMHAELPVINKDGRIVIAAKSGASPSGRQSGKQDTPYATLPNIQKNTDPILRKHGFTLITTPEPGADGVGILMHGELSFVCDTQYGRLVHHKRCAIPAPLETGGSKNNVQGVGSSLSYTRRFVRLTLLDIISEAKEDKALDDDGKAASGPASKPPPKINKEQVDTLVKLIVSCGVSRETFCAKYDIETVRDLLAKDYEDAVAACNNYAARNK